MKMIYPSDLAISALGISPDGVPYDGPSTCCSHCGKPIENGEMYSPVKVGEFFSDTRELAAFTGVVCGACLIMRRKKALNGFGFTVTTKDAIYPIAQDIHKAWLFLDPPEPPFVAVHSSSTMMHLIWRTPVTLSKELIYLRFGQQIMTIRPGKLRHAVELAKKIQLLRSEQEKSPPLSPYAYIDRELRSPDHGRLSSKALPYMSSAEQQFFWKLSQGEIWALGVLLKSKPPVVPTKPEPKIIEIAV